MSVAFASARPRSKGEVTQQTIQKMLDENHHLIQCIMDYQSKGKTAECTQYQQILHRNLVYLATIADSNQNMQSLLPAPPSQNMNVGPGGMSQSASAQGLHSQSNLNDSMSSSLPTASLMQGQITNGPSHTAIQSSGQTALPPTSMSLPVSSHAPSAGYSQAVSSSQGVPMQSQGQSMGSYTSRGNLNLPSSQVTMMHQQAATSHYSSAQAGSQHYQGPQPMGMLSQGNQGNSIMAQRPMASYRTSQGSALQYTGQDEFYGEPYGHSQSSNEPINQQYYSDGHGEYSYQQSSYGEPGYERSFEESSQHYYEGGNSAQYSQPQASYQQSSSQQQPFSQQQYPTQQNYGGQQQAYGPGQAASAQYSSYQAGQGQQYSSYRPSQATPSGQTQRPYAYDQSQYGNYQQ
ncbi:calcium-responsive transactivator-like isoform X3 [Brienomyrus brachyistius]|uniref:calcium-responsive transactivator-like isoform X3 n=1 Tax=Brienomyrus brachyistius TaxID=42636 RepID=UPI0020B41A71|nr:calcium-responsive transactivator-like isoform X3 [Brienomyrus brachyistius]